MKSPPTPSQPSLTAAQAREILATVEQGVCVTELRVHQYSGAVTLYGPRPHTGLAVTLSIIEPGGRTTYAPKETGS